MKRYLFIALLSFSSLYPDPTMVEVSSQQWQKSAAHIAEQAAKKGFKEGFEKGVKEGSQNAAANNYSFFSWSSLLFNRYTFGGFGCACFVGIIWQKHCAVRAIHAAHKRTKENVNNARRTADEESEKLNHDSRQLDSLRTTQEQQSKTLDATNAAVQRLKQRLQKSTNSAFDGLVQAAVASHSGLLSILSQEAGLEMRIGETSSFLQGVMQRTAASLNYVIKNFGEVRAEQIAQQQQNLAALLVKVQEEGVAINDLAADAKLLKQQISQQGTTSQTEILKRQLACLTRGVTALLDGGNARASASAAPYGFVSLPASAAAIGSQLALPSTRGSTPTQIARRALRE